MRPLQAEHVSEPLARVLRRIVAATVERTAHRTAVTEAHQEDIERRRDEHQAATSTKKESTHA